MGANTEGWYCIAKGKARYSALVDTRAYIDYMRPRCQQLHRVLKNTGSYYYHGDWHASHYVKVMLPAN